jgi:muramoyltetrapeptide carboxypeptidase
MVKTPPYLKKGDTIGIVCPAGFMAFERVQNCINALQDWGYKVKIGATVGSSSINYFSGTDDERLHDFQTMLDDDEVQAVLCARGGYGITRIIDKINFRKFKTSPKWLIGFSDITLLHLHVFSNYRISTMHAPMAGAFNDDERNNKYLLSLKKALEGKHIAYQSKDHPFNRKGEAVGELIGGNLALIAHSIGTPSDVKTKGRILFIEDVGEYLYNIDRMMFQLKRAGKFDKLAGLIVGGFSDNKDTDRPFGTTAEVIIREVIQEYDFPVSFGFPVGHGRENLALKIGEGYKLKVSRRGCRLSGG